MTSTQRGIIKSLKEGWGFIRGDDGIDRFFHQAWLTRPDDVAADDVFATLVEQQRVTFVHEDAAKGPRAVDISVITSEERIIDINRDFVVTCICGAQMKATVDTGDDVAFECPACDNSFDIVSRAKASVMKGQHA